METDVPIPVSCVYQIDAEHRICWISEAWQDFAEHNHGGHLTTARVIGRSLWDFISDPSTRYLYRALVDIVLNRGVSTTFGFRCDSPSLRRHMRMVMSRPQPGMCRFTSTVLSHEPRNYVPFIDSAQPRGDELVRICSWCKKVANPRGHWVEVEHAVADLGWFTRLVQPMPTHGICPDCEQTMHRQLAALIDGSAAESN